MPGGFLERGKPGGKAKVSGQTLPASSSCWKAQPRFKFTRQGTFLRVGHVPLLRPQTLSGVKPLPLGLLTALCTVLRPVSHELFIGSHVVT